MPVREALAADLTANGSGVLCSDPDVLDDHARKRAITLVYCDSEENWQYLAAVAADEFVVVAMIVELEIDHYARALAAGASGVVHYDTPSSIVTSVLHAADRGEVVLPTFAGHALAAAWADEPVPEAVTDYEVRLLTLLASGARLTDVADEVAYSDRTIRRQLQSLYLKLGVANRYDAIRLATRAHLI